MKKIYSRFLIALAVPVLLICLVEPVFAGAAYWVDGRVTAEPITKKQRYIQVDGKTYTLVPDILIMERYEDRPGAMNDRAIAFDEIRVGRYITMKVEGLRVLQIIIYEGR